MFAAQTHTDCGDRLLTPLPPLICTGNFTMNRALLRVQKHVVSVYLSDYRANNCLTVCHENLGEVVNQVFSVLRRGECGVNAIDIRLDALAYP